MKSIELIPNLKIDARGAAILKKERVGIVSDLHIGMEEYSLTFAGIQTKHILSNFSSLIEEYNLKKIILNGDIKHGFGKDIRQEWSEIKKIIEELEKRVDVVILKGNHDFYIQNIVKGREVLEEYRILNYIITHGHKYIEKNKDEVLIIGNEHPALVIKDEVEAYVRINVFLFFRNENILVLPASNPLTKGTNILQEERFLSPNLKNIDSGEGEVYAINEDELLYFGKLRLLKKHLKRL